MNKEDIQTAIEVSQEYKKEKCKYICNDFLDDAIGEDEDYCTELFDVCRFGKDCPILTRDEEIGHCKKIGGLMNILLGVLIVVIILWLISLWQHVK